MKTERPTTTVRVGCRFTCYALGLRTRVSLVTRLVTLSVPLAKLLVEPLLDLKCERRCRLQRLLRTIVSLRYDAVGELETPNRLVNLD